ncbi:hypothetical protein [Flavobacterium selenitireducens]|uniref:hypothetical protein n=1 Tax=Flavobacterium selenitireducens TaxID=2722704 RepID=UPI00168AB367|nr:hypothetical protein [Flavobacterium selenitireducens]
MNHGFIDGGLGKVAELVFTFSYEDGSTVAKPNDVSMSRVSLGKHIVDKNQNYQSSSTAAKSH